MHGAARGIAIGAAALAVLATACSDGTGPSSKEPALYEGAPVFVKGGTQVSALVNGKVISSAVHQWAVDGIVQNGIALAEREPGTLVKSATIPTLAITDKHALAESRRLVSRSRDQTGNTHEFVFLPAKNGGPTASIVHLENGRIAQAYSYDWRKVRGGWIAKGFAVTVFKNGRPIATVRSGSKLAPVGVSRMLASDEPCMFDAEYAALSGNCDGAPTFGGGGSGGSGGGGGTPCSCADVLAKYLAAAWAAGMGTEVAMEGLNVSPYTWAALGGAWIYVGYLLMSYDSCVQACQATSGSDGTSGTGSGGGGASGWNLWTGRSWP